MAKKARQKKGLKPVVVVPHELTEDEQNHAKRLDWEVNHEAITTAFYSILVKKKRMPTYTEIAAQIGLSTKTIARHFEDPEILESARVKLRALRDRALITVAVKAISGKSVWWSKLFLDATEGEFVTKKMDVKSGGQPIAPSHSMTDEQFQTMMTALNANAPTT